VTTQNENKILVGARITGTKAACPLALLLGASLLRGETKVLTHFTLIDGSSRPPLAGAAMIVDEAVSSG